MKKTKKTIKKIKPKRKIAKSKISKKVKSRKTTKAKSKKPVKKSFGKPSKKPKTMEMAQVVTLDLKKVDPDQLLLPGLFGDTHKKR